MSENSQPVLSAVAKAESRVRCAVEVLCDIIAGAEDEYPDSLSLDEIGKAVAAVRLETSCRDGMMGRVLWKMSAIEAAVETMTERSTVDVDAQIVIREATADLRRAVEAARSVGAFVSPSQRRYAQ